MGWEFALKREVKKSLQDVTMDLLLTTVFDDHGSDERKMAVVEGILSLMMAIENDIDAEELAQQAEAQEAEDDV